MGKLVCTVAVNSIAAGSGGGGGETNLGNGNKVLSVRGLLPSPQQPRLHGLSDTRADCLFASHSLRRRLHLPFLPPPRSQLHPHQAPPT